ncbi:uncharacterized protein LOC132183336 [Corylus avellana]|uniref:uncharacterized protein LOC132183336 n=1 Tax=Corylus avellana TaxID=13451 RepID=UPI00286D10F4|nr:uncharacterized protein LOC132183336 [Corylus avellana]
MGFYWHPEPHKRKEAWSLLKYLRTFEPTPWVCAEDFNEILSNSKKCGGRGRARGLMNDFQNALETCVLHDIDYRGPKYTLTNGQEGIDFTQERLDRVVANQEWCELFPGAEAIVEATINSDHNLILLRVQRKEGGIRRRRGFRYEASWGLEPDCHKIVKQIWRVKDRRVGLSMGLRDMMNESEKGFLAWQHVHGSQVGATIKQKEALLVEHQGREGPLETHSIHTLKLELNSLLEQEELKWRQRAKEHWLKEGDRNTKFFHESANQKRKSSQLYKILDVEGRPYTVEEVSTMLNQMSPLKAPGPDGFSVSFFHTHWGTVGPEVLANRLKAILPHIISKNQSAFIQGKLISDNILAAYETLHTMQARMWGKDGYMAVKLDMSNAYDRVEWGFLEAVMRKMGFDAKWIHLILMCVSSATYLVIVNATPMGRIVPSRGIRQGQQLNKDKTSIFFSHNTSPEIKQTILVLMGIPKTRRYDKYLGLPALVGKSRSQAFKSIKDRVWKRMQDWKLNFLSQAGNEVLLKAVVQAIPTYSMSIFKLPKGLNLEINAPMQKFLWGYQKNDSRIHWMSWNRKGV